MSFWSAPSHASTADLMVQVARATSPRVGASKHKPPCQHNKWCTVFLGTTKFAWDPNKAASNAKKHQVAFDEAVTVFDDLGAYYEEDEGSSELRVSVVGYSSVSRLRWCSSKTKMTWCASSARERQIPMSAKNTRRATKKGEQEPSATSLREIPPIKKGRFLGRGKEGLEAAKELFRERRRGRPSKDETPEGTVAKTVRLPRSTYDELVRLAKEQGISTHVALRKAVAIWIVKARKAS
jgi:uncharacterized DUF497 family protein